MLLVPMAKMLARSWVTTTTVVPRLSRRLRISSSSRRALIGSRPADGSSKNRSAGIQSHGPSQSGSFLHHRR